MKKLFLVLTLTSLSGQILAQKDSTKKNGTKKPKVDQSIDSASLSWRDPQACKADTMIVDDENCKKIKVLGDKPGKGLVCCNDPISEGENPYVD